MRVVRTCFTFINKKSNFPLENPLNFSLWFVRPPHIPIAMKFLIKMWSLQHLERVLWSYLARLKWFPSSQLLSSEYVFIFLSNVGSLNIQRDHIIDILNIYWEVPHRSTVSNQVYLCGGRCLQSSTSCFTSVFCINFAAFWSTHVLSIHN